MARRPTGYWDERSKRYYVRLGEYSEKTGKRRALMLKNPDGKPVAFGDAQGVAAAVQRLLAAIDEAERRRGGPTVGQLSRGFLAWHKAHGSRPSTICGCCLSSGG